MPSFRPRFTVYRLMIAVALSPIVIFAGMEATEIWGKKRVFVFNFNTGVLIEPPSEIDTWWPAVIAMVASTVMLGLAWGFVERWIKRTAKPDPSEAK